MRRQNSAARNLQDVDPAVISLVMAEMGRRGGKKGAATLNAKLTPLERSESARRAAKARWAKQKKSA